MRFVHVHHKGSDFGDDHIPGRLVRSDGVCPCPLPVRASVHVRHEHAVCFHLHCPDRGAGRQHRQGFRREGTVEVRHLPAELHQPDWLPGTALGRQAVEQRTPVGRGAHCPLPANAHGAQWRAQGAEGKDGAAGTHRQRHAAVRVPGVERHAVARSAPAVEGRNRHPRQ